MGIVAALEWRGRTVGTLRLVPLGQGISPIDALVAGVDAALTLLAWEFGRLVLDPRYRSSPDLVRQCVFLGMRQLSARADAQNVFACCTPMLARLYRRFGATVLARTPGQRATGDDGETYCLIHGTVDGMLRTSAPVPQAFVN